MSNSADFKELDFAGVTHQAVDDAYESALKKDIKLERDIVEGLVWVNGNFGLLQRAILNLVMNAIKFAPKHSVVIIRLRYSNSQAVLNVIDNGPGIPDSIRDHIFFPLVSGREGGSGLGLTLAQTFVQQHHGLIEVDSVPGRTDFKILIPLP